MEEAPKPAPEYIKYKTVTGYFKQDDRTTDDRMFDYTVSNFGLLDITYETDAEFDPERKKTQWQRFENKVERLNQESNSKTQYKVLYMGRHGEGYHNVAEAFYGTHDWDCYWSLQDGNGTATWADALLTTEGIAQAKKANAFWHLEISTQKIPTPESYYTSPLMRCLATADITFSGLKLPEDRPFTPTIKELIREAIGAHTCDRRSTKTEIQKAYPNWPFEHGFAENDLLWDANLRETNEAMDIRLREALDDIFSNDEKTFISISSHSGAIGSILRVLGHRDFSLGTGQVIPVLVKAEKLPNYTSSGLTYRSLTNPIKIINGSDPQIIWDNGKYYLTTTSWGDIRITTASTLEGLKKATPTIVWSDTTASRCCDVWSPEMYKIDGTWYIYYTAGPNGGNNYAKQKIWVLKGGTGSPVSSSYAFLSQIQPPVSSYDSGSGMIDPSVFRMANGKNYFLFSGWPPGGGGQSIYISELLTPSTISNATLISQPFLSWELHGASVNAGPSGISHAGLDFITYSASLCTTQYPSLGLLSLKKGNDPLLPESWTKSQDPIFKSANGVYGPAGNGFFRSPDGTQDWIVFHVNRKVDGGCDGNRQTFVQKVDWGTEGEPKLGDPAAPGTSMVAPSGEK
ncbi:hypothetical protein G7Y89_g1753 [Cudoniella acicularis]|uniref:Phosphoglycerate mutase-like protein n=1 Tax=Cudoniella acicularis TaxID=354080 RepID=A0A8H4RXJ7_9HELO|nr:hypothetical protein G7Y89_g1753 [Cudoniella acicularis]